LLLTAVRGAALLHRRIFFLLRVLQPDVLAMQYWRY